MLLLHRSTATQAQARQFKQIMVTTQVCTRARCRDVSAYVCGARQVTMVSTVCLASLMIVAVVVGIALELTPQKSPQGEAQLVDAFVCVGLCARVANCGVMSDQRVCGCRGIASAQ